MLAGNEMRTAGFSNDWLPLDTIINKIVERIRIVQSFPFSEMLRITLLFVKIEVCSFCDSVILFMRLKMALFEFSN